MGRPRSASSSTTTGRLISRLTLSRGSALRAVLAGRRTGQPRHELLPRPRAGAARDQWPESAVQDRTRTISDRAPAWRGTRPATAERACAPGYALTYDSRADGRPCTRVCSRRRRWACSACRSRSRRGLRRKRRRRHLRRSEQLGRRRRLCLPPAGRAGLRLVADRRAAVQHLPACRMISSWASTTTTTSTFQREFLRNNSVTRVLRRLARPGSGLAQGDQRSAARLADE